MFDFEFQISKIMKDSVDYDSLNIEELSLAYSTNPDFLFMEALIDFDGEVPYYLLGPSREMVNPIGSIFGITILLIILFFQRRLFSRNGRFLTSTVSASFKDEMP